MSEERPGIVQYADNLKENMNGSIFNAIFFQLLENRGIFDLINFLMKNIEKEQIAYPLCEGKNEKLATKHRETGNRHFTDDNFVGALDFYNKSIAYGRKSDNLSLCYANRSAVYYELGMFEKCLENISKAKELKYPISLMPKINKRAEDARRDLLSSEEVPNRKYDCLSKLTKPASKEQPFIIDCLEGSNLHDLKTRIFQTKSALVAGDIISKEMKPVSQLLKPKLLFTHCTYCLTTDAAMSMIPCQFCSSAMFCNTECYRKANELFHRIECPIIDAIYGMLSESMWLGLRTVLIGISICGTVEKYQEFLVDATNNKKNILEQTFMESENSEVDALDQYRAIVNLPVDDEIDLEDCAGAAFALKLLKDHSKLINDANIKFMTIAIHNSMKVARENALLLEETYSMIGLTNDTTFYGRALFPFACNFNLSCAPNFLLLNNKTSMLGVVIRPIPAGSVLYAGLVALNHITGDQNYRQNLKKTHLGKSCNCIACEKNYDRMENLRPSPNIPQPTVPNSLAIAALMDSKGLLSVKQYKFFCDYINKHTDLEYLSFQMASAITQLIFMLGKMAHPHAIEMKLGESLGEKINI